ncbi:MAG: YncE family protein [Chloroflexota bacterium]
MTGRLVRVVVLLLIACWMLAACSGRADGHESSPGVKHQEYVFADGRAYIYDIDHHMRAAGTFRLPGVTEIKGVAASVKNGDLYVSYLVSRSDGWVAAYTLQTGRLVWRRSYSIGVDSMCLTPNGKRMYLPEGDYTQGTHWRVIDTANGDVVATIETGLGTHDTACGRHRVYMGPHSDPYLYVASTKTNRVTKRIGPLAGGVTPFVINHAETLAFTTSQGLLGFQVSSLKTGKVLYTVAPKGFSWNQTSEGVPSHGIALSPNGKRVWVIDMPNNYVHVFDVSGLPASPPREVANIKLKHGLAGLENEYESREGWLSFSRGGRYVFVGDTGEVIDTHTLHMVTYRSPLAHTRQYIEIDWSHGRPIYASPRLN